jgi:hypothetical protein
MTEMPLLPDALLPDALLPDALSPMRYAGAQRSVAAGTLLA